MEFSCQNFGRDILQVLSKDTFDKNIIYSPLSIYMALGMTLYGTKNITSTEMMKVLYWDTANYQSFHEQLSDCIKTGNVESPDNRTIKIVNKLFLESKFKLLESYSKAINTLYSGGIEKMNFSEDPEKSRVDINLWVEKQTNGKIKNLLRTGTVHSLTTLILVNAIYFKCTWKETFNLVGLKDFHLLNGTTKQITMLNKISEYKYLKNETLSFSAVQIPFQMMQNNECSLMVILPNEKLGLVNLEKNIFQQQWKSVLGCDLFSYSYVDVTLPKFKIECTFKLKEQLRSLGVNDAFSGNADFSPMTGKCDFKIGDVIHKAFIDVDENGVEAAAATAVETIYACFMSRKPRIPICFKCDHPFMFAIVKDGSLPLFVGHFTQC